MIPKPRRVLLTDPAHFRVDYVINPHMAGHVGTVDGERARAQWRTLRDAYVGLGFDVEVMPGVEGLPDMVFCANQILPIVTPEGRRVAVASRMHTPQRAPEVEHYAAYFTSIGYEVLRLDADLPGDFEGMGDALWHPGAYRLYGGYGYRTDRAVYERLAAELNMTIVPLELVDVDFYHLDTCLSLLDTETALVFPSAFTEEGLALLRAHVPRLLEVPEAEARERFACNAHCPDGRHVLLQQGSIHTERLLRGAGFEPVPLDTSEFLKAGGSVFCMKLMYW